MEFNDAIHAEFEEYCAAIGKVALDFGRLETTLDLALGLLINSQDIVTGQIVVSRIQGFQVKVKLFQELSRRHFPRKRSAKHELHAVIDLLTKSLDKAAEDRNRLVHSSWAIVLGRPRSGMHYFAQKKRGKTRKDNGRRIKVARIRRKACRIRELTDQIERFRLFCAGMPYTPSSLRNMLCTIEKK